MDLILSPSQDRSSKEPWQLLCWEWLFLRRMDENEEPPIKEPSGLWLPRLPTLSLRLRIECGGSGEEREVAPDVAAEPSSCWAKVTFGFHLQFTVVFNVHLKELNLLLDGESTHLGVVLREPNGFDSPNNYLQVKLVNFYQLGPNFKAKVTKYLKDRIAKCICTSV